MQIPLNEQDSEGVIRGATSQRIPCPFSVASTSSAHPSVILTQPAQMIVESVSARQQHSLPPVGARTTSYIASLPTPSSNCPIPVQFVYASNANGQAVPVPVELIQSPSNLAAGIPYAYPVRMISPMTLNIAPTTSADEHWANHLPYWGSTVARGIDENAKTMQNITNDSTTSMSLPPIGTGMQSTLSALRAGMDDALRKSLSESLSSLNSSSRRSADDDSRIRAAKKTEQIYNEQVAERRRLEAQRIEDEKREAMIKEQERRRMEELERERESEEERRKLKQLEDRERTEAALLASIERAKREAEMLKKAKLYKHVLESCESNAALEHSILSEDDRENSRILREVESLERQKQYDFQRLGSGSRSSSAKRALTERGADLNRSTPHSRNNSYDDDRPIKGTFNSSYISKSFGSTPESNSPLCRDRRGRQSMRAPSTPRTNLPRRRADSAERSKNTSSSPVRCSLEKPVSLDRPRATQGAQCLIPVRPQRRIPPPAPRSRRTSSTNDTITPETVTPVTLTTSPSTVTYSTTKAAESFDMIPNGDGGRSRMISSHTIDSSSFPTEKSIQSTQSQDVLVEKPTKMPLRESKSFSTDREIERSFTAPKQSYHDG
ncbi:unnamed protein product [Anisakis simplex]|uniref:Reticulocyte-binding protein 2 a n=1 Tax=Anisakis simplex TaxID=6269 RepID=A0A0M3K4J8_ANISI|nr:unnamed protein product [Anisakis simplex]